ncbi:hypothetical protein HG535_0D06340 [Zygotorulaspora mrakii]|uniref:Uncharacterized protein n=1 Tax=Zygotorulaspora mrakii TaxID=42260 RepID=A0A7H9B579_ZYGMR|nr:uncharacterized protein HG535_0D06340 [Zygotorulaspora mrakii]QLG72922.1 hypothetical protein HG535_0D06340 [Zygotorulaspora mrakii]
MMDCNKNLWIKIWNHPIVTYLKTQWFTFCLAIFIIIARFAPNFAANGGLIKAQYTIGYGAVAWIFLQSGISMKTSKLLVNMGNWRAHLVIFIMSFLITSSIIYGFCCAIKASNNHNIDEWVLVGLLVTATCPTTVASNVVLTTNAGGNELLSVCEVFLGNTLGAFITPALVQMYTRSGPFQFGNPAGAQGIAALYGRVMKQVGLTVFLPLLVGQLIQNFLPKISEAYLNFLKRYHIKIGTIMLLLVMFSSFSTAFKQGAFTSVPHVCIIFLCFFNFGVYVFFTGICFVFARPFFIPMLFPTEPIYGESSKTYYYSYKIFKPFYYCKRDSICIMFCGASKTAALGVSLITSQYANDNDNLGKLLVPLVLYQSQQVITASLFVPLLKKWCSDEQPDVVELQSREYDIENKLSKVEETATTNSMES